MNTNLDETSKDNHKTAEESNELDTFDTEEMSEVPLSPREAKMALLVEKNQETRESDKKESLERLGFDPDDLLKNEEEPEEIIEGETEEILEGEEPIVDKLPDKVDTPVYERDGQYYLKLKINGKDHEQLIDNTVVTNLQKRENLDVQTWQTVQERKKLIDQQNALTQQQQSTIPDDKLDTAAKKRVLKDAFTKMYDGDIDKAVDAYSELLETPAVQSEPKNIDRLVDERVDAKLKYEKLASSFIRFQKNPKYKVVVDDKLLLKKVDHFTDMLQNDEEFLSTNPTNDNFFEEAGDLTLKWIEGISGKPAKSEKEPSSIKDEITTRQERKRLKADPVKQKMVRRGIPKEKERETKSDIIHGIAKRRHHSNF